MTGRAKRPSGRPATRPNSSSAKGRPVKAGPAKGAPAKGRPAKGAPAKGPTGTRGSSAPRSGASRGGAPRQSTEKGLGGTQVEGRQSVRELLLAGKRRIHEVNMADDLDHAEVLDDIAELAQDLRIPVRRISRRKLEMMSRTEASQGVVATAAELPDHELDELCRSRQGGPQPFLIALDGVTDPGNLGALIRTAECAGVTGILLPRHRAVHVTPTVTKAAAGAVEHVPIALVGGLPAAIGRMQELGVWVIGLDAGGASTIHQLSIDAAPVCLVLGAEGSGLSRLVAQRCDVVASIPMRGQLGSLNVSVAGAVAIYEIVRRRS